MIRYEPCLTKNYIICVRYFKVFNTFSMLSISSYRKINLGVDRRLSSNNEENMA